jgi:hypothetical protein
VATYATSANAVSRLAGRTVDGSSKPTLTEVGEWVDEGEALILGALSSGGAATAYTNANGLKILRSWICDYAEGRIRQAWVAAIGGGEDDGIALLERFYTRLDEIANNPSRYESMLAGGGSSESSSRVRSHVINNADGKTIANGDFDPVFEFDNSDPSTEF